MEFNYAYQGDSNVTNSAGGTRLSFVDADKQFDPTEVYRK